MMHKYCMSSTSQFIHLVVFIVPCNSFKLHGRLTTGFPSVSVDDTGLEFEYIKVPNVYLFIDSIFYNTVCALYENKYTRKDSVKIIIA